MLYHLRSQWLFLTHPPVAQSERLVGAEHEQAGATSYRGLDLALGVVIFLRNPT